MYHAIFSRCIDINVENIFGLSRYGYHAMYRMISTRYFTKICTTRSTVSAVALCQHVWRVCSYRSISKPETKTSVYKLTAESAPRIILCLVGCMDTSSTQVDAREGNFKTNPEHVTCNFTRLARTVVGKEEECLPCDPPRLHNGGSLTK